MSREQMKRQYVGGVSTLVAAGNVDTTGVMTVSNRVIVRGWDFNAVIYRFTPGEVAAAAWMRNEITRATTINTNFGLAVATTVVLPVQNVAGADYIGTAGTGISVIARHLSQKEAEDLGLVLDYGESIRMLQRLYQVGTGATEARFDGFFFYQDI